jgi:hypothetical protein
VVYITVGTIFNMESGDLFTRVLQGVRELPMACVPMGADQPLNAARCTALGAARMIDATTLTPEDARAATSAFLTEPLLLRGGHPPAGREAALPPPEHVFGLLERLAVSIIHVRGRNKAAASITAVPAIWTIGYEKLLPPELVAELEAAGVERVIDVRYRPQSRRPGMSKTRLSELLGDRGIAYEHRKALGTPPDLRWLFHAGKLAEAATAYREHVESVSPGALDELAGELDAAPRTALLCLEAAPEACHRRIVTDSLRARRDDLEVVDL